MYVPIDITLKCIWGQSPHWVNDSTGEAIRINYFGTLEHIWALTTTRVVLHEEASELLWVACTNQLPLPVFLGTTLTMGTGASVGRGDLVLKRVGFVHLSWSGDARGTGTDTCISFGPQYKWLILVSSIWKLRDRASFFPCWR